MATFIEDTPVYRDAMAFAVAVDEFILTLPRRRAYLADQLLRASLSILLNLREGGSEIHPREKARFYRLAKRSAAECAAALDFTANVEPPSRDRALKLREQAAPLITQLYRMSRSQSKRAEARTASRRPERRKASPA